jgi:deazaflavin-dependent oxidoreductase (nitroreductase family)
MAPMPLIPKLWDLTGGALLLRSGSAGRLTTVGRTSGESRTIQCGFLRHDDGSLLVGSAQGRSWPLNLAAAGWCDFEAKGLASRRYRARPLEGAERDAAVAEFRTARGPRAASVLSGQVFELTPSDRDEP